MKMAEELTERVARRFVASTGEPAKDILNLKNLISEQTTDIGAGIEDGADDLVADIRQKLGNHLDSIRNAMDDIYNEIDDYDVSDEQKEKIRNTLDSINERIERYTENIEKKIVSILEAAEDMSADTIDLQNVNSDLKELESEILG